MKTKSLSLSGIMLSGLTACCAVQLSARAEDIEVYSADWESLDSRPTPEWFSEAKFGIFIHWGVYSVPAWGPRGQYAEWYWSQWFNDKDDGPWRSHHREMYGDDFKYERFAPQFKAEFFDAAQWADIFKKAGARYVVLTSKHHEGFCLWPAPESKNWNSVDIGPGRDLCGELTKAVRKAGLRMGFYYSLHNWFHPAYAPSDPQGARDISSYVEELMLPQLKDLVTRYKPDIVWPDGEWTAPAEDWRSKEFLAWLFNESPVRDKVAVNDRWGAKTRSRHGGFYTTEYGEVGGGKELSDQRAWEECRGIGASFGYNRNENLEDYMTADDCIALLIDTVSRGGNLLLNIGPTADGRIPVIMQERLIQIGDWLAVNGEAIYASEKWTVSKEQGFVHYTAKGDTLYAICTQWPGRALILESLDPDEDTTVRLLGRKGTLEWGLADGKFTIDLSSIAAGELPCQSAWTFVITR